MPRKLVIDDLVADGGARIQKLVDAMFKASNGYTGYETASAAMSVMLYEAAQALAKNDRSAYGALADLVQRLQMLHAASPDQVERVLESFFYDPYDENPN